MLKRHRSLPRIRAISPAANHIVCVRRAPDNRPKQVVEDRTTLAIGGEVVQVAIGGVASVRIGPLAGGIRDGQERRIVLLRNPYSLAANIPAERYLDRGFAVAQQVVRGTDTWVDVLEIRHIVDLSEGPRRDETARRYLLRLDPAIEVVVTKTNIQCQLAQRPLVLGEQTHFPQTQLLIERIGKLCQQNWTAIEEDVLQRLVDVRVVLVPALLLVNPQLQRVRASDVGD